jgi:hypothetical protein
VRLLDPDQRAHLAPAREEAQLAKRAVIWGLAKMGSVKVEERAAFADAMMLIGLALMVGVGLLFLIRSHDPAWPSMGFCSYARG